MGASEYHFVTRWRVVGTVDEVSDILGQPEGLARWWSTVYLEVETLEPGDEAGVGKSVRILSRGFLPYTLSWTFRVVESHRPLGFTIEAAGDLVGRGVWTFEQAGAWVDIVFDWRIRVEKGGVKQLSPILKPVFAANHRWAMRQGEAGLREELARRRGAAGGGPFRAPSPPQGSFPVLWIWAAGFVLGLFVVGLVFLRPRRRPWRRR